MASQKQSGVNMMPASPIEGRPEAMRRLARLRHRLFWLHPIGFVVAIVAAQGNLQDLHRNVRIALAITVTAHAILWLNMIATAKMYGRGAAQ